MNTACAAKYQRLRNYKSSFVGCNRNKQECMYLYDECKRNRGLFLIFLFLYDCLNWDLHLFHVWVFFSSPELKTQVSFSDHLSFVVCLSVRLSVRPSVRPSVCLSVNFSHFHLLLFNHWANFTQTWHKASLGEGDSSLFKWRATPFSKGRHLRNSKNTLTKF